MLPRRLPGIHHARRAAAPQIVDGESRLSARRQAEREIDLPAARIPVVSTFMARLLESLREDGIPRSRSGQRWLDSRAQVPENASAIDLPDAHFLFPGP